MPGFKSYRETNCIKCKSNSVATNQILCFQLSKQNWCYQCHRLSHPWNCILIDDNQSRWHHNESNLKQTQNVCLGGSLIFVDIPSHSFHPTTGFAVIVIDLRALFALLEARISSLSARRQPPSIVECECSAVTLNLRSANAKRIAKVLGGSGWVFFRFRLFYVLEWDRDGNILDSLYSKREAFMVFVKQTQHCGAENEIREWR